jgi:hypothetical protein
MMNEEYVRRAELQFGHSRRTRVAPYVRSALALPVRDQYQ